jgi:hypothetical protein
MTNDGFELAHQQLEQTLAQLKTATDPDKRKMLLGRMSWLLTKAQAISSQPPNVEKTED